MSQLAHQPRSQSAVRLLYDRGARSLVASWEAYARAADRAAVVRAPGLAAAVFPAGPERGIYNNALLERHLSRASRRAAIGSMEDAYADAGVDRFAAWVHESDAAMIRELERRGYRLEETTRAMALMLDDVDVAAGDIDVEIPTWPEYQRYLERFDVPPGLLANTDGSGFHVFVARSGGQIVATSLAFDHDGDCGIYNVSTLERMRRRGFGTALTAAQLHHAKARGCSTASVQSTALAEHVYAALGFRDLGRILEFVRDTPPTPDRAT